MGATTVMNENFTQEEPSQVGKIETEGMPRGIPYIIGNEAAERFSYYGMRTILVVFMTQYLVSRNGQLATMTDAEATGWYHMFMSANYFFPILGAFVSDIFWGKYKSIMRLSIVYCLGHLALALDETRLGLTLGLTLIAIGSGGIKPSVSAHVGDQFTAKNSKLIAKAFNLFYFSINFGSIFSTILTPVLLQKYGPSVAFGVPGLLMLIATIIFKIGDRVYVAIPPVGWQAYKKEICSPQGKKAIFSLSGLYIFIAIFWALYDQNGSSWVLQAEHMNRVVDLRFGAFQWDWLRFEIMAAQLQVLNPILVLAFIPLFDSFVYPAISKVFPLNAVRKMIIGMFIASTSFVLVALAQSRLSAGADVSIMWQFWAFFLLTAAEVMVYGTGLEFSYTQAPKAMKSLIMGLFLLTISVGNLLTAAIGHSVEWINTTFPFAHFTAAAADGSMEFTQNYFWFFSILMLVTAVLFSFSASTYKAENYVQSHEGLN